MEAQRPENNGKIFEKSGTGVKWMLGASVFSQVVRFSFSIFLARLLSPEDFGLMAMAILLTEFMARFNNFGLSAALIQKTEVEQEDLSTTFWFLAAVGLLLCTVAILVSPLVEMFFRQKGLALLISINAAGLLIMPVGSLFTAILMRDLNFRAVGISTVVASIVPGIVSVVLAYRGFGVLSLAIGGICHVFIFTFVKYAFCGWSPSFSFQYHRLRKYWNYGTRFFGTMVLDFIRENIDNLTVGKFLGEHSLGIYGMSYNISSVPSTRFLPNIQNVAFPALSKLQGNDESFIAYYLSFSKYLSTCVFPFLIGLYLVSEDLIPVLLGNRWSEVIIPLRILSLAMILEVPIFCAKTAFMARGCMSQLLKLTVFQTIFLFIVIFIGLKYGVSGVASAIAVQLVVIFFSTQTLLLKLLKIPFRSLAKSFLPSVFSSTILIVSVAFFHRVVHLSDTTQTVRLAMTIAVGVVAYTGTMILFYREIYHDALRFFRGRENRPGETVV